VLWNFLQWDQIDPMVLLT